MVRVLREDFVAVTCWGLERSLGNCLPFRSENVICVPLLYFLHLCRHTKALLEIISGALFLEGLFLLTRVKIALSISTSKEYLIVNFVFAL